MDTMGLSALKAGQILDSELEMYQAERFRLTTRLKILKRVGLDPDTDKALMNDLERIEKIIDEYGQEILSIKS